MYRVRPCQRRCAHPRRSDRWLKYGLIFLSEHNGGLIFIEIWADILIRAQWCNGGLIFLSEQDRTGSLESLTIPHATHIYQACRECVDGLVSSPLLLGVDVCRARDFRCRSLVVKINTYTCSMMLCCSSMYTPSEERWSAVVYIHWWSIYVLKMHESL